MCHISRRVRLASLPAGQRCVGWLNPNIRGEQVRGRRVFGGVVVVMALLIAQMPAFSAAPASLDSNATTFETSPSPANIVTVAGDGSSGYSGDDVLATSSGVSPTDVAFDHAGHMFIADSVNDRVRQVNSSGIISTVAGTGTAGYNGDGGAANAAQLNDPTGVAVDVWKNVIIADAGNDRVRVLAVSATNPGYTLSGCGTCVWQVGDIFTIAGTGTSGYNGDSQPAVSAQLTNPTRVAFHPDGDLFIADRFRVRRVDSSGTITTYAGNGTFGRTGDGSAATSATIGAADLAFNSDGDLFVADGNCLVRRVDTSGVITTYAGVNDSGCDGYGAGGTSGDDGPATDAGINHPVGVAVGADGSVYISHGHNPSSLVAAAIAGDFLVRKVDTSGIITTYAGGGSGTDEGGLATDASLDGAAGMDLDSAGNLYVAENYVVAAVGTGIVPPVGGPVSPSEGQTGHNAAERCVPCAVGQLYTHWPVTTPWGTFTHSFTDLAIPGRGPALGFGRTYSSYPNATVPNGPLGYGWSEPYSTDLSLAGLSPDRTATVTQGNGAQITFTELDADAWEPAAPRANATLVYDSGASTYTLTRQASEQLVFDSSGKLIKEVAMDGFVGSPSPTVAAEYTTTLAYASGRLSTVTDAAGRTLTFAYVASGNGVGNIESVTTSTGRAVSFSYDTAGNLAQSTDVNGNDWTYGYDTNHRMTTMLDPNQQGAPVEHPITNSYDTDGRVEWQQDQLGHQTSFDYSGLVDDPAGVVGQMLITDPDGHVTAEQYQYGEKIGVTRGFGTSDAATTQFRYDSVSLLPITIIDPNGHTSHVSYDEQGNQLSVTDPLGRISTATYNAFNQPLTTTDPKLVTTTYTYDNANAGFRLVKISTPCTLAGGSSCGAAQETQYARTDSAHPGDVSTMTDARGKLWTYGYDSRGYLSSTTDPDGKQSTSTYNADGWKLTDVSPKGNVIGCGCAATYTTTYGYLIPGTSTTDNFGDVHTISTPPITSPLTHVATIVTDKDRNQVSVTDPEDNTTTYVFDLTNRLTQTKRADTPQTTTSTEYNDDGTVHQQNDGKNNAIQTYDYDNVGRIIEVTDADNHTTAYSYDDAGNVLTKQDPGGSCTVTPYAGCTTYTYDVADELTDITYTDPATSDVTDITYDDDGQRVAMTDGTGTSTWAYDSLHRVVSTNDGANKTVAYGYNLNNAVTSIVYPGPRTIAYTYADNGELSSVADGLSHTTSFGYDKNSNLTTETFPSSPNLVDTFAYDAGDQLAGNPSISDVAGGSTLFSANYTRDKNGQLASDSSVPSSSGTFRYSKLNQLCYAGSSGSPSCSTYGFDAADNLTTNGATTQQFDAADRLCWTLAGASSNGCVPAPTDATTYDYNASGDRTAMIPPTDTTPTVSYGYDQANRLTSATTASYPTTVLGASPLAYWRLGESSGSTAVDTSGHSDSGTYTGGVTHTSSGVKTDVDQSATFNGSNYVTVASPGVEAGQSSTVSVEAWVKTSVGTGNNYVVSEGSSTSTTPFDGIHINAGLAAFTVSGATLNVTATGTTTVSDNQWHHLVGVRNGMSVSIYVDGRLDGSATGSTGTVALDYTTIGALHRTTTFGNKFTGSIDEPAFFATALSAAQITNHYQAGTTNYAGRITAANPVGFWRLNETAGTSAANSSQNTQTGTYTGGYTLGTGPGAITGETDTAPTFNGTTGYVNVTPALTVGTLNAYSVDAWVKTTATGNQYIVAEGNTGASFTGLHVNAGKAVFTVMGTTNVSVTGTTTINDDQWHYLTGVRSGTGGNTLSIYVDGALDNAATGTPGTVGAFTTTTIGALSRTSVTNFFAGAIADAAFYNSSLTGTQIKRNQLHGRAHIPAATYAYDGDGLRTRKTVNGVSTTYTWDMTAPIPQLLQETTNGNTTSYIYGTGGLPIEQITPNGTVLYYSQDQIGSTRLLTDNGTVVKATYTYDPYGNITASAVGAGVANSLQFGGQYHDNETGFTYLRARFYDPATTQFLTQDPLVAATGSPYAYVAGNPLNAADPSGLCLEDGCAAEALVIEEIIEHREEIEDAIAEAPAEAGDFLSSIVDVFSAASEESAAECARALTAAQDSASAINSVLTETAAGSGIITSDFTLTQNEAVQAGLDWVGPGEIELGNGVYRSTDGLRQFRIDPTSLEGLHNPGVPHVHLEMFEPGVKDPIINNHIPFFAGR
jgi:RHS repeat-associated protein